MVDLVAAAQVGLFTALSVPGVTALADVHEFVPEGTDPPLVVIGRITAEPAGGKDGGLDLLAAEILTEVREPDRTALSALMAAVRTALEGVALTATGAILSPPVFLSSDDDQLEDGQTYQGLQRFSLFAQPA